MIRLIIIAVILLLLVLLAGHLTHIVDDILLMYDSGLRAQLDCIRQAATTIDLNICEGV